MKRLIAKVAAVVVVVSACANTHVEPTPEPESGGSLYRAAAAAYTATDNPESAGTFDDFVERCKSGKVKFFMINRAGDEYRLQYGMFGKGVERSILLNNYPAVRGQIFAFLMEKTFRHMTVIWESDAEPVAVDTLITREEWEAFKKRNEK